MTDTLPYMGTEKKQPATPTTENTRVDREIMRKARVVAPRMNMTVPEYLAYVLRGEVDRHYAAAVADMAKELAKAKRKAD